MPKQTKRMTEKRFETCLANLLERALENRGGFVTTFEDDGILTNNRGVVVHMGNGQEFQLTIVDSSRS